MPHLTLLRGTATPSLEPLTGRAAPGPGVVHATPETAQKDPVRVVYLIDFLADVNAGTEAQLVELIAGLDRRRFAPSLAVLRDTPFIRRASLPCPVEVLNVPSMRSPAGWARLVAFAMRLRRERVGLVHIFFNDAALIGPLFSWLGGARTVAGRRDMGLWYTRLTLGLLRVSNLFVDAILTNSEAVRDAVCRHEGFTRARTFVVPNGWKPARFDTPADATLRQRLGIAPGDKVVGIVANLRPVKRHTDLLKAFARVRQHHPRTHLLLAGAGDLESPLRDEARALGLERAVHFLGRVPDAVPVVKHCDVCVLCSESEGLSNAIVEYFGSGKPVVCTDGGGNSELVQDGLNGFVVPVGDVHALADRITRLLTDSGLRQRMGSQSAALFAERYTSARMVERHMRLYEDLIGTSTILPLHST